ncbi:trypsin-like peptidase domain-containing protein [Halorussus gelatinilyticus]|uniref:Trypsin-like peptidase domain-containing protein n=1 Tax=Halorussus gelatinilyticus TaxID=2937524 RepID=A0A8U0IIX8_9EURY|nr:trypsin-like peptidase domain-containing protein [Halorussus gelatinilyticus]UPW00232.1 trypsin-like peptidase domain-containing protein [Halorussus gelatinilyticus]
MVGRHELTLLFVVVTVAVAPMAALGATTSTDGRVQATSPSLERGGQLNQQSGTAACDYSALYNQTIDSVVQIQTAQGSGSGFVFDAGNGSSFVVTNQHVVNQTSSVGVRFARGETRSGSVVGTSRLADLAVVRVDDTPEYVEALPVADSAPNPGDRVAAIGSPFGLETTITSGIVSGVNRTSPVGFPLPNSVQTDAPINPGNSGGPLVACDTGSVVGVNQAGGGDNIGFAIGASLVEQIVPALIQQGEYSFPLLGVQGVTLTQPLAEANDLNVSQGVYVVDTIDGTPAAEAFQGANDSTVVNGQRIPVGGDVIVAIGNQSVSSREDLLSYLFTQTRPGDTVQVTVLRDGSRQTINVTVTERPTQEQQ